MDLICYHSGFLGGTVANEYRTGVAFDASDPTKGLL